MTTTETTTTTVELGSWERNLLLLVSCLVVFLLAIVAVGSFGG